MSLVKPAALFMCVALIGYADMSASNASTKDGVQSASGEEKVVRTDVDAANSEHSSKPAGKKVEPTAAKHGEKKRETTAVHHKVEKKPASAHHATAHHKGEKKPASGAAHKGEKKPEPVAAPIVEKTPEPVATPSAETKPAPAADKAVDKPVQAEAGKKSHWWWPFGGGDKTADQKAAQQAKATPPAPSPAPVEVKKPEPKPVSQAWLDDNEKRLKAVVAGSKFEVERRGDLLVVVAPADTSFNRDRPNMLLPVTLGPLSKMAKMVESDAQSAVLVLGYGDNSGDPVQGRKLTLERAQAVASIFRMSGLKSDRLMLNGMGADQPRASNDNLKGRMQNRRVEVILTPRDNLPALLAKNSH